MNMYIVVLKDTAVLWDMASDHWPQIVFQYVNVLQRAFTLFYLTEAQTNHKMLLSVEQKHQPCIYLKLLNK